MTREDCGKETKMESDAALEWIAQQCETTQPHEQNQGGCMQVAEPHGCTQNCGTTIYLKNSRASVNRMVTKGQTQWKGLCH